MRERILEIAKKALPQIDFEGSDSLVDDGVLDSLSIVTLISELTMEFGVTFDLEELMPEDFNSLDSMVETVQRLQG